MDSLQQSIIRTVAYFDLFHYPMKADEIWSFMDKPCSQETLHRALNALLKEKILFKTKEHYQLKHDDSLTAERARANKLAEAHLEKARKITTLLSWFPFIRGIAVSGSLSKRVATENSDYDFFIIAAYNHLWLCKLVFSLFIRIASIFGYKKYFCLNYVIDESYLEVEEKNIFTATEIATLMPMHGQTVFDTFFESNSWIYDFFPNRMPSLHRINDRKKNLFTKITEWMLQKTAGQKADDAIMRFYDNRWRKLQAEQRITETGFMLGAMMADKHYCRHYPQHYQQKVLRLHEEKLQKIFTHLSVAYRA